MLPATASPPLPASEGVEPRDQRRQRLLRQFQAAAAPLLEQMVDTLVDAPEGELFRSAEVQLRDLGRQLAACSQQTGLDDRKKGGI